eukprot:scaffold28073_cov79-Isochrysis_galbana.AAC.1
MLPRHHGLYKKLQAAVLETRVVAQRLGEQSSARPTKQRGFGTGSWEWCLGALEVLCHHGVWKWELLPPRLQEAMCLDEGEADEVGGGEEEEEEEEEEDSDGDGSPASRRGSLTSARAKGDDGTGGDSEAGARARAALEAEAARAAEAAARKRQEREARARRASMAVTAAGGGRGHTDDLDPGEGDTEGGGATLGQRQAGGGCLTPLAYRGAAELAARRWRVTAARLRPAATGGAPAPVIETLLVAEAALPRHEALLASKTESRQLKTEVAAKVAVPRVLVRLAVGGDPRGTEEMALEMAEERRKRGEAELPWAAFRDVGTDLKRQAWALQ